MVRSTQSATSRREFLVRSAATAAGTFLSIGLPALGSSTAPAQAMSTFTPSIWFTLTPDGKVTMHIVKAEMGQHIGTALAQVIAEELEVKWDDVRLDSPLESVENFAIYGFAHTANSGSITTEFDRLSRAGAAGRMALIEAGAKVLGATETDCTASNSRVTDRVSGRSVSYGEIIQKVKIDRKFAYPEDFKAIKLKAPGTYNIIGKSIPTRDIPSKTNGQAKYGIDVFLPNMVYGALVIPRTRYGSKVKNIDDTGARKIPGFVKAVKVDDSTGKCTGWVVALAEKFPAAVKAAQALKVDVDPGPYGGVNTADLFAEYSQTIKNAAAGANWVLEGDVDKALGGAEKVLEMEYTTDMVCHATMEPLNATVQFVDGAWHVYTGTQGPSAARLALGAYLSKVLGQKPEDIKIYVHESILGGAFGGKQTYDEILAAAYCAKEVSRPVKLIQTRESTFATSMPRTPSYHKLKAGLKNGQLVAMDHSICCGWMGSRSAGKKYGTDWLQLDSWDAKKEDIDQWSIGGSDHWYDVENHRVRAFDSDRTTWAVQTGPLRSVSNSYNMFVVESFMDEVAHALNRDPLEFRLALLNGKGSIRGIPNAGYAPGRSSDYYMDRLWISLPWRDDNSWPMYESTTVGGALRLANCLRVAAGRAGWGAKKLPPNTGMGIAVSSAEERQSPTWVAGIAEVTVDPNSGRYKIDRLTIAMDAGTVINPLNAKAQIQGAALWGASQVMAERLTVKNGAFQQSNFHDYTPIRLADVPPIDVELIDSGHHPSGVGEPASTVVAPAVANAIYNAVGVRVRHMPITAEAVLAGLKKKA
jgi:isoquinoline 1-oxidoreductase subunit beta